MEVPVSKPGVAAFLLANPDTPVASLYQFRVSVGGMLLGIHPRGSTVFYGLIPPTQARIAQMVKTVTDYGI